MGIIKVEGLKKNYGKINALRGIDIKIEKGEVFGFIGPNGAGKTTTIRILLGIIRATAGNAHIFGKDCWKDAVEIHRDVAYVPGDVNLWSNLTGGEIIDLFVKLRGSGNKSKREELIERFDLDPSKKCRSYSKGNRQKVALVAALSCDAKLYLLDEPSSGLDPLMETVFQECVNEIKQDGKTVFLSSHILSEVEKLCDRVSIIRRGEIIETGTLKELRHLTRNNIIAQTKNPIENLDKMDGIHDLEIEGQEYRFSVDSQNIGGVIDHINRYGIVSFESTPPNLEDLFMHHYSNNGGGQDENSQ